MYIVTQNQQTVECEILRDSGENVPSEVLTDSEQTVEQEVMTVDRLYNVRY